MRRKTKTLEERFWTKVLKTDTCWLWQASHFKTGYGQIGVNGAMQRAHRVAYELTKGPIPEGQVVMHSCDNRSCVNPEHLSLGTQQDNLIDMAQKGRNHQQLKTHCPQGHEYTPENTMLTIKKGTGWKNRVCRECHNARGRRARAEGKIKPRKKRNRKKCSPPPSSGPI